MAKYEVCCYGKEGSVLSRVATNDLDNVLDKILEMVPQTVKIIVHDGETGNYITEA